MPRATQSIGQHKCQRATAYDGPLTLYELILSALTARIMPPSDAKAGNDGASLLPVVLTLGLHLATRDA